MTPENLAFYLRGFAENSSEPPTREQWGVIRATILGATTENVFIQFQGTTPPELAKLLDGGCASCKPVGGTPTAPYLDESKLTG
jgi:hypothetical protein